jgi:hypothetical protein
VQLKLISQSGLFNLSNKFQEIMPMWIDVVNL